VPKKKELEDVINRLTQYIRDQSSGDQSDQKSNKLWFHLVSRGRIYLQLYRYHPEYKNIEILRNAHADFTRALKIRRTGDTLAELAEVCQRIATHPFPDGTPQDEKSQSTEYTTHMHDALTYFLDASLQADGDKSYIHLRYGECLAEYEEHRSAIESFKRAIEHKDVAKTVEKSFQGLVTSLCKLYDEDKSREDLMAEFAFWLNYTVVEKQNSEKAREIVKPIFKDNRQIMDKVLHQLDKSGMNATLELCRSLHDDPAASKPSAAASAQPAAAPGPQTAAASAQPAAAPGPQTVAASAQPAAASAQPAAASGPQTAEQGLPAAASEPATSVAPPQSSSSTTSTQHHLREASPEPPPVEHGQPPATQPPQPPFSTAQPPATALPVASSSSSGATSALKEEPRADAPHSELLSLIPPQLPHAKNKHGKKYDFFVMFSKKDAAQWVYRTLLPKLEAQSKFKGCIEDRDYRLGKPILSNMEASLKDSVCNLLVITPDFLEDDFCQLELDQVLICYSKNMIPIKLRECELPKKLVPITHLDAICHVDWDRMLRELDLHCNK
jgi:tetratricopeptide (TPR) repeat protein